MKYTVQAAIMFGVGVLLGMALESFLGEKAPAHKEVMLDCDFQIVRAEVNNGQLGYSLIPMAGDEEPGVMIIESAGKRFTLREHRCRS